MTPTRSSLLWVRLLIILAERVRKAGDDVAESSQTLVDMFRLFEPDPFGIRLADSFRAGQIDQD